MLRGVKMQEGTILFDLDKVGNDWDWEVSAFYLKKSWGVDLLSIVGDGTLKDQIVEWCDAQVREEVERLRKEGVIK